VQEQRFYRFFSDNNSIMSAFRPLFACESRLGLGAVAQRTAKSFALWWRKALHK